jgi:hypothetical protein
VPNNLRIIKIDQREGETTIEDVVTVELRMQQNKIKKRVRLKVIQDLKVQLKLTNEVEMLKILQTKLVRKEIQDQEVKEAKEVKEVKEVKEAKEVKEDKDFHKMETQDLNKLEKIHRVKQLKIEALLIIKIPIDQEVPENIQMQDETNNLWKTEKSTNPLLKLCLVKILNVEIGKEMNKNLLKNVKDHYLQKLIETKLNNLPMEIVNQIRKE